LSKISSIEGRILYNSRGSKTIEIDVKSEGKFLGRVCAPSGASVGKYEAVSFPNGKPEESLRIIQENSQKFIGLESSDLKGIHDTLKSLDNSTNYSEIGGALAFAVTIASMESASKSLGEPLFKTLSSEASFKFPFPIGNILGGGAHAGPGTPDIQEILICPTGSKTIENAIETNLAVHKELRNVLEKEDPNFTNGRGDEGGWAPKLENEKNKSMFMTELDLKILLENRLILQQILLKNIN
jgi:enolase